jgi:hypothetical protein
MSQESHSEEDAGQQPIPLAWRQTFRDIVTAFVAGDYRLEGGVTGVEPVSAETATQIQNYIQDYGTTLVELPEDTWDSSVCIWTGSSWDALIDLWTQEEGRSDLVLQTRVTKSDPDLSVRLHLVYVP